eukprot:SAG31_NODE_3810_length_3862_cov_2.467712_5_plen_178_part_00
MRLKQQKRRIAARSDFLFGALRQPTLQLQMSLVEEIHAALRGGIVEAVGGGIAGCMTIPICLPLELIMSFQAAGDMPGRPNMLQVAMHLYKSGGIRRFFKAPGAMAATIFSEKFCLFFWYSVLKAAYAHAVGIRATAVGPIVGVFCGWSARTLDHSLVFVVAPLPRRLDLAAACAMR